MGNISKWFDREISLSVGDIIDAKALDNDALHFSEFYVITIYDEKKTNLPVKHRWSKVWTYEMQGHKMYNVFTTFDMALVEYNRQSKEHSNAIMRVERRTLSSLLHGNSYVIKLINVYGDFCYICDGKKAFRDTTKDLIIEKMVNKLKENNINCTVNSGKFITFKHFDYIFKIEVVKKTSMPN